MNIDTELQDYERRLDRWPRNCLIGAGSMTSEHASRGPGSL